MELNRMIDHTILKPEATEAAVQKLLTKLRSTTFSLYVSILVGSLLLASNQQIPTSLCVPLLAFLGANTPEVKAYEAADAIKNGANEVDMVINIGALKSQQYDYVRQDIQGVVDAAKGKALVKVIIETALLTDEEKVKACELAKEAGADFVKTSTGFSTGGAKVADIRLMRETVGPDMGVKASGGVHNAEEALAMIEAGATRIGASTGVAIVSGATGEGY